MGAYNTHAMVTLCAAGRLSCSVEYFCILREQAGSFCAKPSAQVLLCAKVR